MRRRSWPRAASKNLTTHRHGTGAAASMKLPRSSRTQHGLPFGQQAFEPSGALP
jgi:hypothetical protein